MNTIRRLYIIEYWSYCTDKYQQEYFLNFDAASKRMLTLLAREKRPEGDNFRIGGASLSTSELQDEFFDMCE